MESTLVESSFFICEVINLSAYVVLGVVGIFILTHIISTLYLKLQIPLKLTSDSFVVITGGCLGLGKEMVIEIAKLYHCKIMVLDYRQDLFKEIQTILTQLGAKCECYHCDLADDESVEKFIKEINKRNQPIDLFIHNAGIIIPKKFLTMTEKQFLMQQKVNFLSPVKIIKETFNLMKNGHIAVISSMVALVNGGLDISSYTSSKHALYSFVNSFRQQLKAEKKKTTISMGCPYFIKTGMFDGFETKLDFIFKHLEPKYVAQRLVKEFIMRKEICFVYQYESFLFKLCNFLPSRVLDFLSINLNVSNLKEIKSRHDSRVKNFK